MLVVVSKQNISKVSSHLWFVLLNQGHSQNTIIIERRSKIRALPTALTIDMSLPIISAKQVQKNLFASDFAINGETGLFKIVLGPFNLKS